MGTRGRVPNPALDQRSREYGWTTIPSAPHGRPVPKPVGKHTARATAQWRRWWEGPLAVMWGEVDRDVLERLLTLYEAYWTDPDTRLLGEIRNLEDRFGLTPAARRRLYWRIEGIDIPATAPAQLGNEGAGSVLPAAGGKGDPRLRVVS